MNKVLLNYFLVIILVSLVSVEKTLGLWLKLNKHKHTLSFLIATKPEHCSSEKNTGLRSKRFDFEFELCHFTVM